MFFPGHVLSLFSKNQIFQNRIPPPRDGLKAASFPGIRAGNGFSSPEAFFWVHNRTPEQHHQIFPSKQQLKLISPTKASNYNKHLRLQHSRSSSAGSKDISELVSSPPVWWKSFAKDKFVYFLPGEQVNLPFGPDQITGGIKCLSRRYKDVCLSVCDRESQKVIKAFV